MANNYTLFSFVVENLEENQVKYLARQLGYGQFYPGEHKCHLNNSNSSIAIYSEDCGNVEKLGEILQKFLQHFNLDRSIGFEYVYTCSKPRVGEFGGGSVLVSKERVELKTTYDILEEMCQKYENK